VWYSRAWGQNAKDAKAQTNKLREVQLVLAVKGGTAKSAIVGTHPSQNCTTKKQKSWQLKHICRESVHEEREEFSVVTAIPSLLG